MKLQITIDGNLYELEVEAIEEDEAAHHSSYGGAYPLVPLTANVPPAPVPLQSSAPGPAGDEGKLCRSPITGIVIKANVVPGQTIEKNELIMVLEAMKMETNVTAPRSGKVKKVMVAEGDSVKVNQAIVELE